MQRFFILLALVSACTAAGPRESLREAERLLAEAPDSSLAVLDRLDASGLRGKGTRAEYTLLHTRAQEE